MDALRRPGAPARRDPPAAGRQGDASHAGDLRGADQARAGHPSSRRDPGGRGHGRRSALAAAHPGAVPDCRRGRRRPLRHPRHDRLGRARLQERRAPQPQEVHLRARRSGDRRRRRHLHRGPPPHAHRCGRRARRLRRRRGLHHAFHPRHPRPDGDRGGRRRWRAPRLHGRVGRPLRARDRRRRPRQFGRHRQGDRLRRRRGHAGHHARARDRRPRRRLALGCRGAPPAAAARQPRRGRHRSPRSKRSCTVPHQWPRELRISWGPCAAAWLRRDTRT